MAPININFPNGKLVLTPPESPEGIARALTKNDPFPDDAFKAGAIELGSIGVSAQKDITLGDDVTFKASGSAFAGFGVYRDPKKLYSVLKKDSLDARLILPDEPEGKKNLYLLR